MKNNHILHIVHPEVNFLQIIPDSLLLVNGDKLSRPHHHSSLGDANLNYLISIAVECDQIVFHPEKFDINSELYKSTVLLLSFLSHRCKIQGFDLPGTTDFLKTDVSTGNNSCLWVFGCSHSYGVGLSNEKERYSNILAEKLELDLKMIAEPGSSLFWSLCKLVQSPIKNTDHVIWQITTPGRLLNYKNKKIKHTKIANYPSLLDFFDDDQIFFEHITFLQLGISYLRAKEIKFTITSILPKETNDWFYTYHNEYVKYPEYCYTPDIWVDFGNDDTHAGPLSNKLLASRLIDHLQYTNG